MKPIIKWAGGKYKLSKELETFLPKEVQETKEIKRYIEPFFGGGGFFFYLHNYYDIEESVIIDKNEKLINLYKQVSENLDVFLKILDTIKNAFLLTDDKKEFFYSIREKFNRSSLGIQQAVFFMFLNKTCFNGLYRENSSGGFNVPFGSYKTYNFYDLENIAEVSKLLKTSEIIYGNFYDIEIQEDDLFYLDPPYIPLNKTSNFTSYTKEGFGKDFNSLLLNFMNEIDKNNARFILSNSYSEETLKMYKKYNISYIQASRSINSNSEKRNKIKEIVVRNYK